VSPAGHGPLRAGTARRVFVALVALALGSCIRQEERAPAFAPEATAPQDPQARGTNVFSARCARCHGETGQGTDDVPVVLGTRALPEFARGDSVASRFMPRDPQRLEIQQQSHSRGGSLRGPFRTAQDLYDYVSVHKVSQRGDLKPDEIWALVALMITAQGSTVPAEGIGPVNAVSTLIERREQAADKGDWIAKTPRREVERGGNCCCFCLAAWRLGDRSSCLGCFSAACARGTG
jgi:Cytochrome c